MNYKYWRKTTMAIIQLRIDDETKKRATELFEGLGFDLSSAIRAFIRRSLHVEGFPFPMIINDRAYDPKVRMEREQEIRSLLKRIEEIEKEELEISKKKFVDLENDEYGSVVLSNINDEIYAEREKRYTKKKNKQKVR